MKKILSLLLVMAAFVNVHAQDSSSTAQFYLGVGVVAWSHFRINDARQAAGLKSIGTVNPGLSVGELITIHKFQTGIDISGYFGGHQSGRSSYSFGGGFLDGFVRYRVFDIFHEPIYAGAVLSWNFNNVVFYNDNGSVNFNNLNPSKEHGSISMFYNSLLIGPSVATGDLFPHSKFSMIVKLDYQFNLIHGRWKSDYTTIIHAQKEAANAFTVSVLFPFDDVD